MHEPLGDAERLAQGCWPITWGIAAAIAACRCCASCNPHCAKGTAGQRRGASTAGPQTAPQILDIWPGLHEGRALRGWQSISGSTYHRSYTCASARRHGAGVAGIMKPPGSVWAKDLMSRVPM